jgi:hypothetical protein
MARKSTEIVGTQLRIRESLRRRLEQAAARRGVSLNFEMTDRLARSFETENVRTLDTIRADMEIISKRLQDATFTVIATTPGAASVQDLIVKLLPPQLLLHGIPSDVASEIEAIRGAVRRICAAANIEMVDG